MLCDDPARDRQTKSSARFVASLVGSEEALENTLSVLRRDSRPVVRHRHAGPLACRSELDLDARIAACRPAENYELQVKPNTLELVERTRSPQGAPVRKTCPATVPSSGISSPS